MNRMRLCFLILISALECFAQYPLTVTPYQIIDGRNGAAKSCNNCSIYTYAAGTTTPLAAYTDSTLGTQLPNPVKTNSAGYAISNSGAITGIWTSGSVCYKIILKDAGAVTVWSQDNVCNPAIAAANLATLLASSAGSSHVGFLQSGTGAVAETVQAKLRQTYNVLDFGAVCDGTTDDRAKIQAAIDAVVGGTLNFPNNQNCAVSAPGLFLYPANAGITITANQSGGFNAGGGGLVAYAANPPTQLLTIYAENATLNGITFDGNNKASTNGIVSVLGLQGTWSRLTSVRHAGDGMVLNQYGGPSTNIISQTSNSITVGSITNNGICNYASSGPCSGIALDPFGSNPEQFPISNVSGNVITVSGTILHTHTTAVLSGSNNLMRIQYLATGQNGGWGFHVIPGSDENGIRFDNHSSTSNALGGELWHGSVHIHTGGMYEGDGGPAVSLGDAADNALVAGGNWGPLGDLEESSAAFNGYSVFCGDLTSMQFTDISQVTIAPPAASCSSYHPPSAQSAIGYGTGQDPSGTPSFWISTTYGQIPLTIYPSNPTGACTYPGEIAFIPTGSSQSSTIQYCVSGTPQSITVTTGGATTTLTTSSAPSTGKAYIAGYTGTWAALNGVQSVTNTGGTTFTVAINSSGFGSVTGTPTVVVPQWTSSSSPSATFTSYATSPNCITGVVSGGFAQCGAAAAGTFILTAGQTIGGVLTTAVHSGSEIFVQQDTSVLTGTLLSVTCNTTPEAPVIFGRATSGAVLFEIEVPSAFVTNPGCFNYWIVN